MATKRRVLQPIRGHRRLCTPARITGLLVVLVSSGGSSAQSIDNTSTEIRIAATTVSPRPITWTMGTGPWAGQYGRRETVLCPAGGTPKFAWGTDVYTDDSSVCTAAVHAGFITPVSGGAVTIEVRPDTLRYNGSTRNGVTTGDWIDVWPSSFIFIWGEALKRPAPAIHTNGMLSAESWLGQTGRVITVLCPAHFELLNVFGTDTYAVDSAICPAAVHAGQISQAKGGLVTILLVAGLEIFQGSSRNGVASFAAESRSQGFVFIPTPTGTPPPPTADTPFLPPPGSAGG